MRNTNRRMKANLAVMCSCCLSLLVGLSAIGAEESAKSDDSLKLALRERVEHPEKDGRFELVVREEEWDPAATALIICDMWNQHWCKSATARVRELAPRINKFANLARERGVFIIHAPSETMKTYRDHPARKRAMNAPRAENVPEGIDKWRTWMNEKEQQAGYPIEVLNGGCDCETKCEVAQPCTAQIAGIEIHDRDAISDSGVEIWNLLEARHIQNALVVGVHTNMCVAGRPFGLRNLKRFGKNAVLVRDLTDTMYDPEGEPKVQHFTGTDLIIEHIEKYICPTTLSSELTGEPPFRFRHDDRPMVAFIMAEREYDSDLTLPAFAHDLQIAHDFAIDFMVGSVDEGPGRNCIHGVKRLAAADAAVLFARRRGLPEVDMRSFRNYLNRGMPLVGIRTASHAFAPNEDLPEGYAKWPAFDREVLGCNYQGHYGEREGGTQVRIVDSALEHPIVKGITPTAFVSAGSLYKSQPLAEGAKLLMQGSIPEEEPEPVFWTHSYRTAPIAATSLGHPNDFGVETFRQALTQAIIWGLRESKSAE